MKKQLSFLILSIIFAGLSYGQKNWINLNQNLKITDTVWKVQYKAQYLLDSSGFKIYRIIMTNNTCENNYSGLLNSTRGLNSISGSMVLYYNNNQIKSKGNYYNGLSEGEWIEYYDNGRIDNQGMFIKGKKNGEWIWYFKNGQISSKEKYEMDKLISVEMYDSLGQPINNPDKVDRLLLYKKSDKDMNGFREYLASKIKLPDSAAERNISRVVVHFCIDEDGNLKNEQVEGIDKSLNEEVLRVLRLCNKWIPAIQHNRKVKMSISFPMTFIVQ